MAQGVSPDTGVGVGTGDETPVRVGVGGSVSMPDGVGVGTSGETLVGVAIGGCSISISDGVGVGIGVEVAVAGGARGTVGVGFGAGVAVCEGWPHATSTSAHNVKVTGQRMTVRMAPSIVNQV